MIVDACDALPPGPGATAAASRENCCAGRYRADWRLRLSMADVDLDGPFSPFPA
jgi:environmental stress-induced protein Ves